MQLYMEIRCLDLILVFRFLLQCSFHRSVNWNSIEVRAQWSDTELDH